MKKSSFNDYLWSFVGIGGQNILQFLILLLLARLLEKSDFGLVGIVTVIISFVQIFSLLGVGPAIVQIKQLEKRHLSTAMTISICIGLVFVLLIYYSAPAISLFFRMPELEGLIKVITIIFPIMGISNVSGSYLQRKMKFKLIAKIDLCSYFLAYGLVGVALAYHGMGAWSLVIAQIVQSSISAILQLINYEYKFSLRIDRNSFRQLMFFGGGFTIGRISNYFANQADYFVVGRMMNANSLGLYTIAFRIVSMPANLFGTVVDRVLFSTMASIQDDKVELERMYFNAVKLIFLVVFPLTSLILVLAPELVDIFLGAKWQDAAVLIQLLVLSLVFRTSYKISDSLARATGKVYHRAWRQVLYALMVFVFCYVGTFYGLKGVALGASLAIFLNYIFMLSLSLKILEASTDKYVRMNLKYFTVFLIILPILWGVKLLCTYYIGYSVYWLSLLVTGTFVVMNIALFRTAFYIDEKNLLLNLVKGALKRRN